MYYLVRDYYDEAEKKIFSDKNDIKEWVDELDPDKRVQLLVYNWEDGMHSDCRAGRRIYFDQYFILKKSENVFDFIEVGDLVRMTNSFYLVLENQDNYILIVDEITGTIYERKEYITAIYKPDKHGNYIKVWERVNENENI